MRSKKSECDIISPQHLTRELPSFLWWWHKVNCLLPSKVVIRISDISSPLRKTMDYSLLCHSALLLPANGAPVNGLFFWKTRSRDVRKKDQFKTNDIKEPQAIE